MKRLLKIRRRSTLHGFLFAFLSLLQFGYCVGQVSTPSNIGGSGDYLGWDASLEPEQLNIWHQTPGQPIIFRTNNQERILVDKTVANSYCIVRL